MKRMQIKMLFFLLLAGGIASCTEMVDETAGEVKEQMDAQGNLYIVPDSVEEGCFKYKGHWIYFQETADGKVCVVAPARPSAGILTIPEGFIHTKKLYRIEAIDAFAYCDQTELQKVVLPQTLKRIGEYAFWGCSQLLSFNIPVSVTELGSYFIDNCESLTDIYVHWKQPFVTDYYLFYDYYKVLHVPYGCREAYLATEYWNNFQVIVGDL